MRKLTQEQAEHRVKGKGLELLSQYVNKRTKSEFLCYCGNRDGNICAHHLDAWNKFKEKRFDIDNGVCLCKVCHIQFHRKYGYGNNTRQQYIEFKG